jgi:hypothetical protein
MFYQKLIQILAALKESRTCPVESDKLAGYIIIVCTIYVNTFEPQGYLNIHYCVMEVKEQQAYLMPEQR